MREIQLEDCGKWVEGIKIVMVIEAPSGRLILFEDNFDRLGRPKCPTYIAHGKLVKRFMKAHKDG